MEENKEGVVGDGRKVIKISKKKIRRVLIILVVIIVILILGSVVLSSLNSARSIGPTAMNRSAIPSINMDYSSSKESDYMPSPRYNYNNDQASMRIVVILFKSKI